MIKKIIKNLLFFFYVVTPHKKTILFESGDNVFDNGYVFAKYVSSLPKYKKFKLIFIGKKDRSFYKQLPPNIHYYQFKPSEKIDRKFVKISLRSKYIFYSYDNFWRYIKLPKSCKIIFIRHGAFPIKSIKDYFNSMFDNQNYYYCLCNTKFVKEQQEKAYPKNNVVCFFSGMPRCDLIKKSNGDAVRDFLHIGLNAKIVLVACTFRKFDDNNSDYFKDEFPIPLSAGELKELNDELIKKNVYMVFKLHHAQFCNLNSYNYSNLLFLNNEILINNNLNNYDLFNASSSLITDYSGIFIDYLLVDKPICFLLADKNAYSKQRGFTLPNFEEYLPGYFTNNKNDFFKFVFESIDNDIFSSKRKTAKTLFLGDYNNCCKTLLEEVEKL